MEGEKKRNEKCEEKKLFIQIFDNKVEDEIG